MQKQHSQLATQTADDTASMPHKQLEVQQHEAQAACNTCNNVFVTFLHMDTPSLAALSQHCQKRVMPHEIAKTSANHENKTSTFHVELALS